MLAQLARAGRHQNRRFGLTGHEGHKHGREPRIGCDAVCLHVRLVEHVIAVLRRDTRIERFGSKLKG
jgi:hypothetical protein